MDNSEHNYLPTFRCSIFKYIEIALLKFIIWYEADILLLPGESMKLYSSKVLVNGKYHYIKVYNMSTYSHEQWEILRKDHPAL